MKPLGATAISIEATDEQLVLMAQDGSSEAFALLFRRYRPAIARYAARILGDDGRAEDIVQEVFLSALRSIHSLHRPAGFKPWLYRIAHNTCVDHVRRTGRNPEVHMDASLLPASEEIRLFRQAPSTHATVSQREDFRNLREALGELPASQFEVLVMRELEGLSYDEIAGRMGLTRASVESMLFRARQGLRDEYGQITTGERCLRMRPVMARLAEGMGGLRDRRALARHVRRCQPCRRDAFAMGLSGPALEAPQTGLRGGLTRVASLLPLPWLIHRRSSDATDAASSAGGGGGAMATQAQTAINQLSVTASMGADQAATVIHKAVAVAAAVAVVGGGGIAAVKGGAGPDLLLKPDATSVPARADTFEPKVPPALQHLGERGARAPLATAGAPSAILAAPAAPAAQILPGGVTTPAPTSGTVPAPEVIAPTPPDGSGGGSAPGDTPPSGGGSGGETTAPAAGPAPSETTGGGATDGGTSSDGGAGGSSGGGGDSGGGGGDTSTDTGGSTGGGDIPAPDPVGAPPVDCDLPHGLDKKDKVPPGHAKKCDLQAASAS